MSRIYSTYNPYGSNLARKNKRRFFIKISFIILLLLILLSSGTYLIFFSSKMAIKEVLVNGLQTVPREKIDSSIDNIKNQSSFLNFKFQNNILFFNTASLEKALLDEFRVIRRVEAKKEFPNKLSLEIEERAPIGVWCLMDNCRYFDDSGVLWGSALRSSGPLLLNVEDLRSVNRLMDNHIEKSIFEAIIKTVELINGIGVKIKNIELPADEIGDFKVNTLSGYYILLNEASNISGQIEALKILLNEKGGEFSPIYIDLRLDGRVYYK